eukprot:1147180-Prymnesium_polylepis.1
MPHVHAHMLHVHAHVGVDPLLWHMRSLIWQVGHFDGPRPVLLTDTTKDDLSILLCGSDPAHSQIEFGAHQVLLQPSRTRAP